MKKTNLLDILLFVALFFTIVTSSLAQSLEATFETHSLEDVTYSLDYKQYVGEKSYFSLYAQHNTGSSFMGAYSTVQTYHNMNLSKGVTFSVGYQRLYFVESKKNYNLANLKLIIKIF